MNADNGVSRPKGLHLKCRVAGPGMGNLPVYSTAASPGKPLCHPRPHRRGRAYGQPRHRPTVSPAKNYLACFSSIGCIDHQIWKGHREEAKNGPPWEHRIMRNEGAMVP